MSRYNGSYAGRRAAHTVRKMSDIEAAWIGAMVEAEGSVSTGGGRSVKVSVNNTDVEIMSALLRVVGDGSVHLHSNANPVGFVGTKPCWVWSLSRKDALPMFLPQILPYLTSKRVRAEEFLQYLEVEATDAPPLVDVVIQAKEFASG